MYFLRYHPETRMHTLIFTTTSTGKNVPPMGRPSDACEASRSMLRCSMLSTSIVDAAHVSSHGLLSTSNTVWGKHLIFSCYLLFDKSQPFEVCQTNTFYQFFMLWFTNQRSDLWTTPQNTVFPAKVCVFLLSPLAKLPSKLAVLSLICHLCITRLNI